MDVTVFIMGPDTIHRITVKDVEQVPADEQMRSTKWISIGDGIFQTVNIVAVVSGEGRGTPVSWSV